MLGLLDDLSQQSSGGTEVIVLIGQQVLEHHRQELKTQRNKEIIKNQVNLKTGVKKKCKFCFVWFHLWSLLWTVLQHRMEHLHVVGISGVRQLIKDHQLHHGAQVVFVSIQQLPGESKALVSMNMTTG